MKRANDFFLSVVAVTYNDSDIIAAFMKDINAVMRDNYVNYEIIIIDDGSTDGTGQLMEKLLKQYQCVRYLRLSRRFGIEIATSAGLDTAIGDVIVILEPELDPPKFIPRIVRGVRESNSIVYGINTDLKKVLPLHYRFARHFYHEFVRLFLNFYPPKNAGNYIGLSRQHLNAIVQIKDRSKFLRIFSSQIGFRRMELPYKMQLRRKKLKRKSLLQGIQYGIEGITTNSLKPLKLVALLCSFAAFANVLYIAYILCAKLLSLNIQPGWATLSIQSSVMFCILFMALAVNAEYMVRLIDETKDRPLYYVSEEQNSSVMLIDKNKRRNVKNEE